VTRTALVVGGSGGIGSAIVRRLAEDGLRVAVGYHEAAVAADELAVSLPGSGHVTVQLSVTDPGSLAEAARLLEERFGQLDVLVNGAGITRPVAHDDLDGLDDELIDAIMRVNWRGPFATVRALRRLLERGEDPVVINLSSVAAVTGLGSNVAYCASKAALDSMTRSLARALAPRIRMVSVSPGWVLGEYAARMPAEVLERQRAETPLDRLATPEDVAATVSAVVHHLPMTTGAVVPVDGGRPLGRG
jgi:3-oxoacyl-[acyl-carrier protein] reductase